MDERLALQSWQQNTLGAEGPSGSWEGVGRGGWWDLGCQEVRQPESRNPSSGGKEAAGSGTSCEPWCIVPCP